MCHKNTKQIATKKQIKPIWFKKSAIFAFNKLYYMSYLNRIADKILLERLEAFGAVLIEGPKWCGKTTTAEQVAKSVIKLQDTDMREEYLATAASKPSLLLQGEVPRLLDEWQDAPVLWDAIRTMVDKRKMPGQFILSGSNSIDRDSILDILPVPE